MALGELKNRLRLVEGASQPGLAGELVAVGYTTLTLWT